MTETQQPTEQEDRFVALVRSIQNKIDHARALRDPRVLADRVRLWIEENGGDVPTVDAIGEVRRG
jgi:hypothetical protein